MTGHRILILGKTALFSDSNMIGKIFGRVYRALDAHFLFNGVKTCVSFSRCYSPPRCPL
jgi:hypothetical protein